MTSPSKGGQSEATGGASPRLSATRIQSFQQCPSSWYRREVLKESGKDYKNARIGTAVHGALEGAARIRWSIQDLPGKADTDELIEHLQTYLLENPEAPALDQAELSEAISVIEGVRSVDLSGLVAPPEVEWSLDLGIGKPLEGKIDLLLSESGVTWVVDWKTGEWEPPDSIEDNIQANVYMLALKESLECEGPIGARFYYLRHGEVRTTRLSDNKIRSTKSLARSVGRLMLSNYSRAVPGDWCSYCPFSHDCEAFEKRHDDVNLHSDVEMARLVKKRWSLKQTVKDAEKQLSNIDRLVDEYLAVKNSQVAQFDEFRVTTRHRRTKTLDVNGALETASRLGVSLDDLLSLAGSVSLTKLKKALPDTDVEGILSDLVQTKRTSYLDVRRKK
jgi:hypothetical protein